MSSIMQYEFRLFGPRKGQTVIINGHPFVNGIARLVYSSEAMSSCMRVLSFYNAHARGTQEYNDAMDAEEAAHGTGQAPEAPRQGADDTVPSCVRQAGTRSAPQGPEDSIGGGHSQRPDATNVSPVGDGHEHAGIPKFPEDKDFRSSEPSSSVNVDIKAAVMKLDPEVDDHWVMTGAMKGSPKLNSVEEAYGKANLTRQDVEAAAPGYSRDVAFEAALSAA